MDKSCPPAELTAMAEAAPNKLEQLSQVLAEHPTDAKRWLGATALLLLTLATAGPEFISHSHELGPRLSLRSAAEVPTPTAEEPIRLRERRLPTPAKKSPPNRTVITTFPVESTTTTTTLQTAANTGAPNLAERLHAERLRAANTPEAFIAAHLDKIPTLAQLHERFPNAPQFQNAEVHLAYIDKLAQEVNITLEDYKAFKADTSRTTAFKDHPFYNTSINPTMFVFHYTAIHVDNVDDLVHGMMTATRKDPDTGEDVPDRRSVDYFVDDQATPTAYKLIENDRHMTAQALKANEFTQGVEIEANDETDIQPAQLKQAIMTWVQFCTNNNLPVNRSTGVGHYEVDLLRDNFTYDPKTGTFGPAGKNEPYVGKFDGSRELMERVVVPKGMQLYAGLKQAGLVK